MSASSQCGQSGFLAKQRRRPCQISQWLSKVHCSRGNNLMRSRSIFMGSMFLVRPRRAPTRETWVSTTTPSAMSKAFPRTTLAVFVLRQAGPPARRASAAHLHCVQPGAWPPWREYFSLCYDKILSIEFLPRVPPGGSGRNRPRFCNAGKDPW